MRHPGDHVLEIGGGDEATQSTKHCRHPRACACPSLGNAALTLIKDAIGLPTRLCAALPISRTRHAHSSVKARSSARKHARNSSSQMSPRGGAKTSVPRLSLKRADRALASRRAPQDKHELPQKLHRCGEKRPGERWRDACNTDTPFERVVHFDRTASGVFQVACQREQAPISGAGLRSL